MALCNALKVNSTLEELELPWEKIVNDGGKVLGELIKLNKIWAKMYLSRSEFSPEVAINIAEALMTNTVMRTLN